MMNNSLKSFNKMMQSVNEEVGILPFSLLGLEFLVFTCGISLLVTSSGIESTTYITGFGVGAMNLLYLVTFFQVIELSTESRRAMSEAWQMAEECVSDPFTLNVSNQAMRMRKSLKFFLITESVVPAKACDTIVIDRSLILSFFAQAIPFTVMLFTTVKELEQKLSTKKGT